MDFLRRIMQFEQKMYLANLYDIYYELLTLRQQEIFELFVEEDFTLTEIADYLKVSLPAVSKTIKEISQKLKKFEAALKISQTYQANLQLLTTNQISQTIIDQLK